MKTLTFYGGFHNVGDIRIRVTEEQYNALKEEDGSCYFLSDILSKYQMRRLNKHFCGMDDCECGGVINATIVF